MESVSIPRVLAGLQQMRPSTAAPYVLANEDMIAVIRQAMPDYPESHLVLSPALADDEVYLASSLLKPWITP